MKINRAKLRGKPLDEDCNRANRTTWEIQDKCKECGAFVDNAKPLESEVQNG